MTSKFTALLHSVCNGMVAPALSEGVTEEDLRQLVGSRAICFKCGKLVRTKYLVAEYGYGKESE